MIPFAAPVVYSLAGLYLLAVGNTVGGIVILVFGSVLLFVADHFVRPFLIGGAARVPFLLVLLGILGGLQTMGFLGLFLGPAVMAALVALWREWTEPEPLVRTGAVVSGAPHRASPPAPAARGPLADLELGARPAVGGTVARVGRLHSEVAVDLLRTPDFASLDIASHLRDAGHRRKPCWRKHEVRLRCPGRQDMVPHRDRGRGGRQSETMRHAVEKYFRKEQDKAAQSFRPISKVSISSRRSG